MAAVEPVVAASGGSNLKSRVVVALFLGVVAIADIWIGGPAFTLMIAAGVGLVLWEWGAMHGTPLGWRVAGLVALAGASVLAHLRQPLPALILLLSAILILLALSILMRTGGKRWISTGLAYAGLPAVALIWLRQQPDGFALVMWTMGLVWATDILAYFAGRAIGGPKIWPAVSPNKTWAGLAGGMTGAALFSMLFAHYAGWPQALPLMALLGAGLAVVAQAGDFFESWLKRRAGVKDSGKLLPGHGGIMDRVDGLVPVACAVALWVSLQQPAEYVMAMTERLA
ncbi:phosphatidate cytidylyltransferase [Sandaracinobacter neustonicus]|nr:phosphatidate cytidylyltransferase [Sandaracinobacter neustonicus]